MKPASLTMGAVTPEQPQPLPSVLLVDDDDAMRRALSRSLSAGYKVTAVASGEAAIVELKAGSFDAVVCDVNLLGMTGVELLRQIREHDLDLPVLLMTGAPSLETAMRAVEYGAARYLTKPLELAELRKALSTAVGMHRLAVARRQAVEPAAQGHAASDRAGLDVVVSGALQSLRMVWQPIVHWQRRRVIGYEALMRTRLPSPEALLDAAERIGRLVDVGRAVRAAVATAAATAPHGDLYVNLVPSDLLDEQLYDPSAPLTTVAPRVVLEITERAQLDSITDVRARVQRLRKLGYRIAVDDLGAGYAGLASFALLEPDVAKIDLALVRDVHRSPTRRRLIGSLLQACTDLHCTTIAEGVELPGERDALAELGCELFQGYLFARPGAAFPEPAW